MNGQSQLMSSAYDGWRTPRALVERIVAMLGVIELDPCADDTRSIPAVSHFTAADDCLTRDWVSPQTVYANPPYGKFLPRFVERFMDIYQDGGMGEGILLVPARPDTKWFQMLWCAHALCFVRGRLRFVGASSGAPFPSVLAYVGPRRFRFADHFSVIGKIVLP